MKNKYNKFLTILFVLIIIGLIVLAGFWIYDKYQEKTVTEDATSAVDEFLELVGATNVDNVTGVEATEPQVNSDGDGDEDNGGEGTTRTSNKKTTTTKKTSTSTSSTSSTSYSPTYKGFPMVGSIEIPKTKIKYPILAQVTKKSIEKSVAVFYSPGLNQIGNTIIMGHNYRNGLFFSKNKNLEIGDKIYITDLSGNRLEYTIYDKYETSESDSSYLTLETNGTIEVTLATCTDYDTSRRIIIRARA